MVRYILAGSLLALLVAALVTAVRPMHANIVDSAYAASPSESILPPETLSGADSLVWWVSQEPPFATSAPALRRIIAARADTLMRESLDIPSDTISTLLAQHEDRIRVAVYAMLSAERLLGATGDDLGQIAQGIKETAVVAYFAEAQIASRNRAWRFIFGGDQASAAELAAYARQLGEQDAQLESLLEECAGCDPGAVAILEEQVAILEQEQQRLMQVSADEMADGGALGSFRKILGPGKSRN